MTYKFLEQRPVSRKTPRDGRLEISAAATALLGSLGIEFPVVAPDGEGVGRLESLECTCEKGAGRGVRHVHHFVHSSLFTSLAAGSEVRVQLDGATGTLRIEQAE